MARLIDASMDGGAVGRALIIGSYLDTLIVRIYGGRLKREQKREEHSDRQVNRAYDLGNGGVNVRISQVAEGNGSIDVSIDVLGEESLWKREKEPYESNSLADAMVEKLKEAGMDVDRDSI